MTARTSSKDPSGGRRGQDALRLGESKFRALFENMAEGFVHHEVVCDEEGRPCDLRYLEVNPAFERHTTLKAENLLGRTMYELFPDAEFFWVERMCKVAFDGEPAHFQAQFGPLGRWFEVSAYQTQRGCFAAVFFDITEHKRLLRETEEAREHASVDLDAMAKLQRLGSLFLHEMDMEAILLEIVDVAISISGADFGNIQILDDTRGDLRIVAQRGFPDWWIDYWNEHGRGQGSCGAARRSGERVIVEDVERSPEFAGSPSLRIQLEAGVRAVQSTPLLSRSGRQVGMFSTHYKAPKRPDDRSLRLLDLLARQAADMIERAQTEEALRRAHANNEAIVGTAADAIVIIDERGTIQSFNHVATEMFGLSPSEAIGQNVRILMPSPYREEHDRFLSNYLTTGRKKIIGTGRELTARRKDGTVFPVQLWVSEWQVAGQRSFTGFLRDLTHKKRLEQEFVQAQKMEAIARLASGIAHDFNNLLAGILGCTRMLRKLLPNASPADELVSEIRGAAERGAALSRQLLSFSRPRSSEVSAFELDPLIRGIERMLSQVIGEDIEVALELDGNGGQILCDPTRLEQIVLNLAVNARDAMPHGGRLTLATRQLSVREARQVRTGLLPAGDYVVLDIVDTGTGMDSATRARLFEPFFTTKEAGRGTGLGLYTVHGIVVQMGGAIDVEGEVGRGTRFSIHFRKHLGSEPATREVQPSSAQETLPGGNETILLVEDERLIRYTLKHVLSQLGYQVLVADRPEDAVRIASEHASPIDLLLTDMVMPGLGGAELARRIGELRPGTKVIFMSAFPSEVLVSQGRIEAGTPTLEKPFDDAVLAKAVREALDGRE